MGNNISSQNIESITKQINESLTTMSSKVRNSTESTNNSTIC